MKTRPLVSVVMTDMGAVFYHKQGQPRYVANEILHKASFKRLGRALVAYIRSHPSCEVELWPGYTRVVL